MSNLSGSGTLRGALSRGGGTPSDVYWDDILDKPDFAEVATSGSYNDLTDKPTIPTYSAGDNIFINNGVISATYEAGNGIDITNGVISATGGGGGANAQFYNVIGDIMGSVNNNVTGYGSAAVTIIEDIVRIDFTCQLLTNGGATEQWGISKTKILALNNNIPDFTLLTGGYWDLFDYDDSHMQYSPICDPSLNGELFTFARLYQITEPPSIGDWGANTWNSGQHFKGVCFGRIVEEVNNE